MKAISPIRMRRRPALLAAALFAAGMALPSVDARAAERPFDDFKIVFERNIFNPNRRSASAPPPPRRSEPPARPRRTERLELLGTLLYENHALAFFDGSDSGSRKVLKPGERIVGHKIADIAPDHVRLEPEEGDPLQLDVGMQLTREEGGVWTPSARSERSERPKDSRSTSDPAATESGSGEGDAAQDDVLQRLLRQRQQEIER